MKKHAHNFVGGVSANIFDTKIWKFHNTKL